MGHGDYEIRRARGTKVRDVEDLLVLGEGEETILVAVVGVNRQDTVHPHLAVGDQVRLMPLLPCMTPW